MLDLNKNKQNNQDNKSNVLDLSQVKRRSEEENDTFRKEFIEKNSNILVIKHNENQKSNILELKRPSGNIEPQAEQKTNIDRNNKKIFIEAISKEQKKKNLERAIFGSINEEGLVPHYSKIISKKKLIFIRFFNKIKKFLIKQKIFLVSRIKIWWISSVFIKTDIFETIAVGKIKRYFHIFNPIKKLLSKDFSRQVFIVFICFMFISSLFRSFVFFSSQIANAESKIHEVKNLEKANEYIEDIHNTFDYFLLPNIFPKDTSYFSNGDSLLEFAKLTSETSKNFLSIKDIFNRSIKKDNGIIISKENANIIIDNLNQGIENIILSNKVLSRVNSILFPENIREKIKIAQDISPKIASSAESIKKHIPVIKRFLGIDKPFRSAILLQNTSELRPTGGFIGSFIMLTSIDGHIEFNFHDIYQFDGQIHSRESAPDGLQSLDNVWHLQDSNFWIDTERSGSSFAKMLEMGGGPGVDTIFMINDNIMNTILDITGPISIQVKDKSYEFNKENASILMSYVVENKLAGEENPKKPLFDLITAIWKKVNNMQNIDKVVDSIIKSIENKDIQSWSKDETIQNFFESTGMYRKIDKQDNFWMILERANIGANKTDRWMDEKISVQVNERKDKSGGTDIIMTLKRWHGGEEAPQYIKELLSEDDKLYKMMISDTNKHFIRLRVPSHFQLIQTIGINQNLIEKEDDAIKFYLDTELAEKHEITFRWYTKKKPKYFIWYGQSGVKNNLYLDINGKNWQGIEYGQNIAYPFDFGD